MLRLPERRLLPIWLERLFALSKWNISYFNWWCFSQQLLVVPGGELLPDWSHRYGAVRGWYLLGERFEYLH